MLRNLAKTLLKNRPNNRSLSLPLSLSYGSGCSRRDDSGARGAVRSPTCQTESAGENAGKKGERPGGTKGGKVFTTGGI